MKSRLQIGGASGTALLLLTTVSALAQPTVTAVSPAANQRNAPRTSSVTLTLSQPLSAGSAAALKVYSTQRGGLRTGHSGTTAVSGNTLTFTPTYPFQAGEMVHTVLTTAAQNANGQALAQPRAFDFMTAVTGGSGTFGGGSDTDVGYTGIGALTPADMDNDGDLDLVMAYNSSYNGSAGTNRGVAEFRNDGNGVFTFFGPFIMGGQYQPCTTLALGDIDGDGDLDKLFVTSGIYNRIQTDCCPNINTPNIQPDIILLADFDGDGDLDICDGERLLFNSGTGTFTSGPAVQGNIVADVDGDGDMDLMRSVATGVSVSLNNGQGSFVTGTPIVPSVGYLFGNVLVGDADGDNDIDIVTLTYPSNTSLAGTIEVRLNDGRGSFSSSSVTTPNIIGRTEKLVDIDGDGDLDILTSTTTSITILLNNGSGSFTASTTMALGNNIRNGTVADVDNDGDMDVIVTSSVPFAPGNTYPSTFM